MDSLASLALATEPPTDAALDRPPYRSSDPLIQPDVARHIAAQAIYQLAVMAWTVFWAGGLGWGREV